MQVYLLLLVAIAAEVGGTTALKLSDGFARPWPTAAMAACYGLTFWLLAVTTRALPIGLVYAIWAGLGIAGTTVLTLVAGRGAHG